MESEEWLEAEPMMKAQSDKNPDGFDHSGIVEAPERPFLKLPFYEQSFCILQKLGASESRLAPRPVNAHTYSPDRAR
jgi:hypothetical protein